MVFQFWFLCDCNIDFFLDMILFIISMFIFLIVLMFVRRGLDVCCFDCYYFVVQFAESVLVFQYLVCRLLNNLSLLPSKLSPGVFALLSEILLIHPRYLLFFYTFFVLGCF